jgi:hypothetical protein
MSEECRRGVRGVLEVLVTVITSRDSTAIKTSVQQNLSIRDFYVPLDNSGHDPHPLEPYLVQADTPIPSSSSSLANDDRSDIESMTNILSARAFNIPRKVGIVQTVRNLLWSQSGGAGKGEGYMSMLCDSKNSNICIEFKRFPAGGRTGILTCVDRQ